MLRISTTAPEIGPVNAVIPFRYTEPSIKYVATGFMFGNTEIVRGVELFDHSSLTTVSPIPVARTTPGVVIVTTRGFADVHVANADLSS